MKIKRKRWVIMRNNRTEILCETWRYYRFKPINKVGNAIIKTYLNKKTALSEFNCRWHNPDFEVEAVAVTETYESEEI